MAYVALDSDLIHCIRYGFQILDYLLPATVCFVLSRIMDVSREEASE